MAEWLFWLVVLGVCLILWSLAYYATLRMYRHKRRLGKDGRSQAPESETSMKTEEH